MICNACGTDNEPGFKFCVKCGCNLDDPSEVNYEQVDMGGYHTEEEYSENSGGFALDSGTFTIRTSAPAEPASSLYTADELNDTDEEFDFSMYDDNTPGSDKPAEQPPVVAQPVVGGVQQPMGAVNPYPQPMPGMGMQQPMGMNPYQQPMMYQQPQIIGYDPSGMPIYSQAQPMMYQQPQIIGYDPSGMPIYAAAQPMMYQQPQIIGYDPNGMPIYSQAQPMMYQQPQIIGYDPNGMPIYSQGAVLDAQGQPMGFGAPPMQNMAPPPMVQPTQPPPPPQPKVEEKKPEPEPPKEEKKSASNDFWAFFNDGKSDQPETSEENDFFAKTADRSGMGDLNASGVDMNGLRRKEKKKVDYMSDTPIVDADKLVKNQENRFNRFYMRSTATVNADDLEENVRKKPRDYMGVTDEVDADMLEAKSTERVGDSMQAAGTADADDLETYIHEHKEALMAQADRAVEALPKKINPYESELDKIELPEYMKARRTKRENIAEIPGIPQLDNKNTGS